MNEIGFFDTRKSHRAQLCHARRRHIETKTRIMVQSQPGELPPLPSFPTRPSHRLISEVESAMLEIENERRGQRAEDRRKRYSGMDAASGPPVPEDRPLQTSSWGAHLAEQWAERPAAVELGDERAELMGDWIHAMSGAQQSSAKLSLGSDGSCTLSATAGDDGSAALRCDGTWSAHEVGRLSQCMPQAWTRLVVKLTLLHGEEVGQATAELPIRWSHVPSRLLCIPEAEGSAADPAPRLRMRIHMHDREWCFTKHRRPLWQDRCALAGLDTGDRDLDGRSDLAVRLAEQARGVALGGGLESCAKKLWLGFWTALAGAAAACTFSRRA